MLNQYQRGSIFGAVIVAVAFAAAFSTTQHHQGSSSSYPTPKIKSDGQQGESFWDAVWQDPVAIFTGALVIVGGAQAALFLWQLDLIRKGLADTKEAADAAELSAEVANKSLKMSKETAERQLIAYVSLKQFGKSPMVDETKALIGWAFNIVWQNTGATPTRDMLSHTSVRFEKEDIPEEFRFPDMWIIGKEQVYPPVTLSPNTTFVDEVGAFSVGQLQEVRSGQKTLYLYGWADYNDVFADTPRHRTEFCARVLLPGDPAHSDDGNIGFFIYRKHNGTDDECMIKPITSVRRETIPDIGESPLINPSNSVSGGPHKA